MTNKPKTQELCKPKSIKVYMPRHLHGCKSSICFLSRTRPTAQPLCTRHIPKGSLGRLLGVAVDKDSSDQGPKGLSLTWQSFCQTSPALWVLQSFLSWFLNYYLQAPGYKERFHIQIWVWD